MSLSLSAKALAKIGEGKIECERAGVVERVDAGDSKSPGLRPVRVRVSPPAPQAGKRLAV